jgi:hypothetical protein
MRFPIPGTGGSVGVAGAGGGGAGGGGTGGGGAGGAGQGLGGTAVQGAAGSSPTGAAGSSVPIGNDVASRGGGCGCSTGGLGPQTGLAALALAGLFAFSLRVRGRPRRR